MKKIYIKILISIVIAFIMTLGSVNKATAQDNYFPCTGGTYGYYERITSVQGPGPFQITNNGWSITFGNIPGDYELYFYDGEHFTVTLFRSSVYPFPITSSGSVCQGNAGVTLGGSDPSVYYYLKKDDGTQLEGYVRQDRQPISWSIPSLGTYTVYAYMDFYSCGEDTQPVGTITITNNPNVYNVSAASCGFNLSSSQTGVTYQVYKDGVHQPALNKVGTGAALSWAAGQSGIYTVKATNGCITSNMTGSVPVTLPLAYTVSGGGAFCSGTSSAAITLSGSQTGVSYQLKNNGANSGAAINGTGSALTWSNQAAAGTYTVVATSSGCFQTMNGSATITVNPLPATFAIGGGGNYPPGGCGVNVTLSGSQQTASYQLRINGTNTGAAKAGTGNALTWTAQATAGTYSIVATANACTQVMSGTATVAVQAGAPLVPPTVNAGTDQSLTLPANSLTVVGTATHPVCPITAYSWTKQSGPTVTMTGNTTSNLALTNLLEGLYVFRLTASANGTSAFDDVQVIIERTGPKAFTYTPNYNGNISAIKWNAKYGTVASEEKIYAYAYDKLNRLTDAYYSEKNMTTGVWQAKGNYNEESMSYDLNGNMLKLRRFDASTGARRMIDNLNYKYVANQLKAVNDSAASITNMLNGFEDSGSKGDLINPEYVYDGNGNMIEDKNKKIKIFYNDFNLPDSIAFGNNNYILYIYSGTGVKLAKEVYQNNTLLKKTVYNGALVFENNVLDFIATDEGRVKKNGADFKYEYFLKDHLGNVRVSFDEYNGLTRVIQKDEYYPFGLKLGVSYDNSSGNKYLYNGKELQDDGFDGTSLGMYDYGARMYDPVLGRWNAVDPMAELVKRWTPYNYCYNNPIRYIDPDGMYSTEEWKRDHGVTDNDLITVYQAPGDGEKDKKKEDRKKFEEIPKPKENPSNRDKIRPGSHIDKQGNFFMTADSYDKLAHSSVIGADVTYIEGGLKQSLVNDIHFFTDTDDINFYNKVKAQFEASGEDYYTNQVTVRYGPVDKTDAAGHKSTYVMRNGQAKYWVSRNADGSTRIEVRAWDYYNVTPQQKDKDGVYNTIAKFLDPLHRMSGGNPNMQTRASWVVNVK